jgi:hypothetical protein
MIPENIIALGTQEAEFRARSLKLIDETPALLEHLNVIEAAMSAIVDHVQGRPERHPDELPLKGLGIRLFNDLGAGLGDALSGYYQQALGALRDIVELQLLFDDFSDDPAKIGRWSAASRRDREREFGPRVVRQRLDARYQHKGEMRRTVYQRLSMLATHPSPEGLAIIAPDGLAILGPFFEPGRLKVVLEEMAQQGLAATVNFTSLFPAETEDERAAKAGFLQRAGRWAEQFMAEAVAEAERNAK